MDVLLITESKETDFLLEGLGETTKLNIDTDKNKIFQLLADTPKCSLVIFKVQNQLNESYQLAKKIGKEHGEKIGKIILCYETNVLGNHTRALNAMINSKENLYFNTYNEKLFEDSRKILKENRNSIN